MTRDSLFSQGVKALADVSHLFTLRNVPMRWSQAHDILFLREVLFQEPYQHRHGSVERGDIWEEIANTLNKIAEPKFTVSKRSVRDRYSTLSKNYKKRNSEEMKASGISPEVTEVDEALEDLVQRFDEADEEFKLQSATKKAKIEEDIAAAQEIRQKSLDTMGELPPQESARKSRNNGSDTVNYLREKMEMESQIKREELELNRQQAEIQHQQLIQQQQTQQQILNQMNTNMQQQQQFQLAFMQQQAQQQQQQQTIMMALLEKLSKDK